MANTTLEERSRMAYQRGIEQLGVAIGFECMLKATCRSADLRGRYEMLCEVKHSLHMYAGKLAAFREIYVDR